MSLPKPPNWFTEAHTLTPTKDEISMLGSYVHALNTTFRQGNSMIDRVHTGGPSGKKTTIRAPMESEMIFFFKFTITMDGLEDRWLRFCNHMFSTFADKLKRLKNLPIESVYIQGYRMRIMFSDKVRIDVVGAIDLSSPTVMPTSTMNKSQSQYFYMMEMFQMNPSLQSMCHLFFHAAAETRDEFVRCRDGFLKATIKLIKLWLRLLPFTDERHETIMEMIIIYLSLKKTYSPNDEGLKLLYFDALYFLTGPIESVQISFDVNYKSENYMCYMITPYYIMDMALPYVNLLNGFEDDWGKLQKVAAFTIKIYENDGLFLSYCALLHCLTDQLPFIDNNNLTVKALRLHQQETRQDSVKDHDTVTGTVVDIQDISDSMDSMNFHSKRFSRELHALPSGRLNNDLTTIDEIDNSRTMKPSVRFSSIIKNEDDFNLHQDEQNYDNAPCCSPERKYSSPHCNLLESSQEKLNENFNKEAEQACKVSSSRIMKSSFDSKRIGHSTSNVASYSKNGSMSVRVSVSSSIGHRAAHGVTNSVTPHRTGGYGSDSVWTLAQVAPNGVSITSSTNNHNGFNHVRKSTVSSVHSSVRDSLNNVEHQPTPKCIGHRNGEFLNSGKSHRQVLI